MTRDRTRTPAAKARTISTRTARRLRIARNAAALVGLIAWGEGDTFADAMRAIR